MHYCIVLADGLLSVRLVVDGPTWGDSLQGEGRHSILYHPDGWYSRHYNIVWTDQQCNISEAIRTWWLYGPSKIPACVLTLYQGATYPPLPCGTSPLVKKNLVGNFSPMGTSISHHCPNTASLRAYFVTRCPASKKEKRKKKKLEERSAVVQIVVISC